MKKVIIDFDNTIGVTDCDVDDGLALLYLLGCENIELLGITTTYGNNRIDVVYPTTLQMLREIGREDIIVKKGGASKDEPISEASKYLVEITRKYPNEITLLVTGSTTNLKGAYMEDNDFFSNVKELVFMGGITSPLVFKKKVMDELNLSCDPQATYLALTKGKKVTVITGNNCLKVLFSKEEYVRELSKKENKMAEYILEKTNYYFHYNDRDYGIDGFYNWDVTAAAYVAHPELFEDHIDEYGISMKDLQSGFLRKQDGTLVEGLCQLNLATVKDEEQFKESIFEKWLKAK